MPHGRYAPSLEWSGHANSEHTLHDSELNVCTENAIQRALPTADLYNLHSAARVIAIVFGGWCLGHVFVVANVIERADSERVNCEV